MMLLLGTKVGARRAYDLGFVNRVVPNGQHETEALAMANELLDSAPLVIGALKRLAAEVLPIGPVERMVAVSQTLGRVRGSEDTQEGIRAYRERRKPISGDVEGDADGSSASGRSGRREDVVRDACCACA
jgi:enoyl-CoA hydratase